MLPTIQQVIKSDTKSFLALGGLQEDKLCDILRAMAPTYIETVHQTSLLHIECNLDRLGLLLPTPGQRSTAQNEQTTLQSVLINKPKFLKAILRADIKKLKYRGPWWWKPCAGEAGARASIQPSRVMCISLKNTPRTIPVRRSLLVFVRRKQAVVSDQLFLQKPPRLRLLFSHVEVQQSPG